MGSAFWRAAACLVCVLQRLVRRRANQTEGMQSFAASAESSTTESGHTTKPGGKIYCSKGVVVVETSLCAPTSHIVRAKYDHRCSSTSTLLSACATKLPHHCISSFFLSCCTCGSHEHHSGDRNLGEAEHRRRECKQRSRAARESLDSSVWTLSRATCISTCYWTRGGSAAGFTLGTISLHMHESRSRHTLAQEQKAGRKVSSCLVVLPRTYRLQIHPSFPSPCRVVAYLRSSLPLRWSRESRRRAPTAAWWGWLSAAPFCLGRA